MTSRVAVVADGSTRLFNVPFPYIAKNHVIVAVNRVVKYPLMDYEWRDDANIELGSINQGDVVEIVRSTPTNDAMVKFYNGSTLTQAELNMAVQQTLFGLQETKDLYEALINGSLDKLVLESGASEAGPVIDKVVQTILDSELLKELQERIVDIDTNADTILATRLDLDDVRNLLDDIGVLQEELSTIIATEKEERIEGQTALASTISLLGARSGDNLSFILDTNKVQVSPTESLATRFSSLQTSLAEAVSLVNSESTSRATADTALGQRIDSVLAQVGDNKALILAEQTARANGDSAEATARQTLQTKVDGHTASIQTQQSVINGLSAQYVVKLDVNGKVAGFGLWNEAGSSQFIVRADKFAIASPTGLGDVVPFAADANGVYINNAYIRSLVVDKISGGAISSQWNLNSTSGRIVLDTGAYMKVIGVGFGAYGDLIEWFGPKMAINQCTKANAITYVGMDGSAYFGGSLRAGVLYNAGQTTSTQADAYVDVGPFWTNGNSKVVVVSYSFTNSQASNPMNSNGFSWNGVTPSATVVLYRSVNGGGYVECARGTFNGSTSIQNETDGPDYAQANNGGSFTFTDNTGASNITYRAQIVARTNAGFTHPSGIQVSNFSQRVGIVSTEQ